MYRDDAQRPAPRKPLVVPQCSTLYSQTRVQYPSTSPACPAPCQIPSPSAGCVKHPDAPVSMSVRISSKSLGRCATHFGREKPGGWTHGGAGQLPEKWGEWSFVTLEMGVVVRVFCSWRGWGQGCFLRKAVLPGPNTRPAKTSLATRDGESWGWPQSQTLRRTMTSLGALWPSLACVRRLPSRSPRLTSLCPA